MKFNKIIYDIREATKEITDDTEISDDYIIYLLNLKRAKYLRQELNTMQRLTDDITVQTLSVKLEKVSAIECGFPLSCDTVMRSCKKLPDTLSLHSKASILRVASLDRLSKPFNFTTREKAVYAQDAPFPNSIYSFLHDDGYIYVTSQNTGVNLLECISVTGIWEDPTDLERFDKCCTCEESTEACFSLEYDYPIQPHLLDLIRVEIIQEIGGLKQLKEDSVNDGNN